MGDENSPRVRVGQPGAVLLHRWGRDLYEAFAEPPYLVGSATREKRWRDVDVRVMLDDPTFAALTGGADPTHPVATCYRWAALNLGISLWGQKVTGLPIDFQFQHEDHAPSGHRVALTYVRFEQPWDASGEPTEDGDR